MHNSMNMIVVAIYLFDYVLDPTQEYFANKAAATIMVGGN